MKVFLWFNAVAGTLYFILYAAGHEVVVRYAVGPFWLLMMVAPAVLCLLVFVPIAQRLRLFDR